MATNSLSIKSSSLVAVAERLRACLRSEDVAARLAGDEFAMVLPSVTSQSEMLAMGQRIVSAFDAPLYLEGESWRLSVSVGMVLRPVDCTDATELMRCADEAMYLAKNSGKGRVSTIDVRPPDSGDTQVAA